jgi:hypothetical protein
MKNVLDKAVDKIKTHILSSITLVENRVVYGDVEKYCRARQATNDNMTHAHCMLVT